MALWVAFPTAGLVAALAWKLHSLTAPAAWAATLVGSAVIVGTGWGGGLVLATFFITATVAPYCFPSRQGHDTFMEARRTVRQVAANGGAAALGGLIGTVNADLGLLVVTAALAAATADTWATEIGRASGEAPRDILTGQPVAAGTSGGVTMTGTMAGAAGAAVIGLIATAVTGRLTLLVGALAIGFVSMLADSFLGSGWQVRYSCPTCGVAGEEARHECGSLAVYQRGVTWLDNDAVNAVATSAAAGAGALWWWLPRLVA